jgi:release factor glutamine methyltransferase
MKHLIGYKELRENLETSFNNAGITELSDIDWICCEVTGKKRSQLPFIEVFSADEMNKIMDAVSKRLKHIPLAYIFGKTNFFGYDFIVDENVLIPRLDTEILIEKVIDEINSREEFVSVLDIGTGSGAIAITLSKETGAKLTAVDVSLKALEIAKKNAELNNANIEFIHSDLFDNISDFKFDIIVSNPPYIESSVIETLDDEVRLNEPILALDGGEDGLEFYRKIINQAPGYLKANGKLFFEIGYNQGDSISNLMKEKFANVQVIKDYLGNDRVVMGEMYD